jgi:iron complex transport system substrate-binding protein
MRVASLSPAATEILFRLGKGNAIVCRDQYSDFPEGTAAIPKIKGHQKMSVDDVIGFMPDVILTGTVVQEKLAAELKQRGLAVIHQDPRTIPAIYKSIRDLGALFSADAEAENLVLSMQQGFNAVEKKARLLGKRPKVYVEEWHNPPMASGNWVPDVVRAAGGEPFPIPKGELSREVTLEEIRRFDPDLIVLSICGAGSMADKSLLTNRPGWNDLRAAQGNRLRVIDDSLLNRPGPRLVEGANHLYGWLFELLS